MVSPDQLLVVVRLLRAVVVYDTVVQVLGGQMSSDGCKAFGMRDELFLENILILLCPEIALVRHRGHVDYFKVVVEVTILAEPLFLAFQGAQQQGNSHCVFSSFVHFKQLRLQVHFCLLFDVVVGVVAVASCVACCCQPSGSFLVLSLPLQFWKGLLKNLPHLRVVQSLFRAIFGLFHLPIPHIQHFPVPFRLYSGPGGFILLPLLEESN